MQKLFLKNMSYLTIMQISNTLLPLLVIPYITRIITPDDFGDLEFTRIYCYYFTIFINYGFDLTTTRQISIDRDNIQKVNQIISQTLYSKLILLAISTIIFLITLGTVPSFQDVITLLILTFIVNIGYTIYPVWYFQGTEKLAFLSILNFIIKLITSLFTLLLISKQQDYWIYNFLQSISFVLVGLISIYLLYFKNNFRLQKFNFDKVKLIFKEAFPVFLGTILVTIITSLFFLILKMYSTNNELAIFSTSNKIIATLQGLILLPFSQAFFPLIAKQVNDDFVKFKSNIKKASLFLFATTLLMGIFLIYFGDLLITIVFGKAYLFAFSSLKIIAFLPMFSVLTNVFAYQGLLSLKKDKLFLRIHILATLLSLLLSFYFLNNYDAIKASWIRLFIEVFLFSTSLIFYIICINKIKNESKNISSNVSVQR